MCYSTTQELWENVNRMYYDLGNQSQIFESTIKITEKWHSLKRSWQDLDLFNTYEWKSLEGFLHHKAIVEDNRILNF